MFSIKPSFNSWYKGVVELGPFIGLDMKDQEFVDLVNVFLLKAKNNLTVTAGIALNAETLRDLKIKRRVLRRLNLILDSLGRIKLNEHDEIKKELTIAIDVAQESLMVLFEFSEFTTTVTLMAKPFDGEAQSTYHVKHPINKTLTLTSVVNIFNYKEQHEIVEDKTVKIYLDFKSVACVDVVKKYFNNILNTDSVVFYLGADNELLKRARLSF